MVEIPARAEIWSPLASNEYSDSTLLEGRRDGGTGEPYSYVETEAVKSSTLHTMHGYLKGLLFYRISISTIAAAGLIKVIIRSTIVRVIC